MSKIYFKIIGFSLINLVTNSNFNAFFVDQIIYIVGFVALIYIFFILVLLFIITVELKMASCTLVQFPLPVPDLPLN